MIQYINDKLNLWAKWVASGRKVVGLGYPGQCAFTRLTPASSGLRSPMFNDEACEIDRSVCLLDEQLRETVEQFYLHAGTVESHAKELRICRDTLYVRLHMAHTRIMEYLQVGDESQDENLLTRSDTFRIKQLG